MDRGIPTPLNTPAELLTTLQIVSGAALEVLYHIMDSAVAWCSYR